MFFITKYLTIISVKREKMRTGHNDSFDHDLHDFLNQELKHSSRESTMEQCYEDAERRRAQLRKVNYELKKQLQKAKESASNKHFAILYQRLKDLNDINKKLRSEHQKICKQSKPYHKNSENQQELMKTPKSRKSVVSICQLNNSVHYNQQKLQARKSLQVINLENGHPKEFMMRNSLKFNNLLQFRDSEQLTERKNKKQNKANLSMFSESQSMRNSISMKGKNRTMYPKESDNIFTNFISIMLDEEKQKQKAFEEILTENQMPFVLKRQEIEMSELEKEVTQTTENIQRLSEILKRFESDIHQMEISIDCVHKMSNDLSKVQKNYFQISEKCKNISRLRVEVERKKMRLEKVKENNENIEPFTPPTSIQVLLRMMGVEQKHIRDPYHCKKELKKVVKGQTVEKSSKKKMRVKELMDTIREGRKKFKELMSVYEGKIKKIEKKITNLKFRERM